MNLDKQARVWFACVVAVTVASIAGALMAVGAALAGGGCP